MNLYKDQFEKYRILGQNTEGDYLDLIENVSKVVVKNNEIPIANAVIVMGFSGNGKTTWISNFVRSNPDYSVVSMDEIVNTLHDKYQRGVKPDEIIDGFGQLLERKCSNGKNVVIDGNFLNLLTRSALADTLKLYGYQVNLVDITDSINDILPIRIMDVASKRMGVKLTKDNYSDFVEHPVFKKVYDEVIGYYIAERKRASIDEQVAYGVIGLGLDNVFDRNTPYEKITHIPQSHK